MDILKFNEFELNYFNQLTLVRADKEKSLQILNEIKTSIREYNLNDENDPQTQSLIIKLDSMLAATDLKIEFDFSEVKNAASIRELNINRIKDLLKIYLKYPHHNVLELSTMFAIFTAFRYLRTSKVLVDLHIFEMKEVKKLIPKTFSNQIDYRLKKIDFIILLSELLYLFKLFFESSKLAIMDSTDAHVLFDKKASSILKNLRTDVMKTDLPESMSTYKDAVNVAKLLLLKNHQMLHSKLEGKEELVSIQSGIRFVQNSGNRVYDHTMLKNLSYSILPFYAKNPNKSLKLAEHAYGLWMEYYNNLPDDVHLIDKIETLRYMDVVLNQAMIPGFNTDNMPNTDFESAKRLHDKLEKSFKLKIELLSLIKDNNLENQYYDTYYQIFKMLQSLSDVVVHPDMRKSLKMFAKFIKTNKKAAREFKNDTSVDFKESNMTVDEIFKVLCNTKSKVFVTGDEKFDDLISKIAAEHFPTIYGNLEN